MSAATVLIERGRAEGKAEGEAEGEARGKAAGLITAILASLGARFGAESKKAEAPLRVVSDCARLEGMISAAITAASVDEFLERITPSR